MSTGAGRELRAETVVEATPAQVWAVLSDVSRMGDWSPELVRMVPMLRGGLREGQQYLGINRRGLVVWPTRSVVCALEEPRVLGWDTRSSGARWLWELEEADKPGSTRIVHRRTVAGALSLGSRVVAPLLLGGSASHADELEAGMAQSVRRVAAAVLAAGAPR